MQKLKDIVSELLHRRSGPWSEIQDRLNRSLRPFGRATLLHA